ncbi:MAG: DsrE family protein [Aequorivita sp.]
MKKTIQIFLLLISFSVFAQQDSQSMNFVTLATEIDQLEPILLAAREMDTEGDFKIVLYGKNVGDLLNASAEKLIKSAAESDVKLSVCQMSLDMLQINHKAVPKEIEIVDNAFLHALQLQKTGYKILNL